MPIRWRWVQEGSEANSKIQRVFMWESELEFNWWRWVQQGKEPFSERVKSCLMHEGEREKENSCVLSNQRTMRVLLKKKKNYVWVSWFHNIYNYSILICNLSVEYASLLVL